MTDRTVTARLRLIATDFIAGSDASTAASKRLREEQEKLSGAANRTAKSLTEAAAASKRLGDEQEKAASRTARASRTKREAAGESRRLGDAEKDLAGKTDQVTRSLTEATRAAHRQTEASQNLRVALGYTALGIAGLQFVGPVALAGAAGLGVMTNAGIGAAVMAGTLGIAVHGVDDAISKMYKAPSPFERLAPSAAALVQEVGVLKPQLLGLQSTLQDRALLGAAGNLDRLADVTLPHVAVQAGRLADDWANAITAVTDAATDPQVLGAFDTVTDTIDDIADQVTLRIAPASRTLATLAVAADPLTQVVGQRLTGAVDRFVARVEAARQSGSLEELFDAGAESADALLSIAGDLLSITGQVVGEVNRQNSALVDAAHSLDAYVDSGRATADVAGIIDTLTVAYEGMGDVLGPLGQVAREAVADPGTREALATMFDILAAGAQTVRVLWQVFDMLPDGIQTTVLAAGALAIVGVRAAGAVTAMGVAAQGAAAKLVALGVAEESTARKAGALAAAGGKAVTALVALQLAGIALEQFEPAAANVDLMSQSLEHYAKTGERTGEMARVLGSDIDDFSKIAGAAGDGFLPEMGRTIESIIPPVKSLNEIFQGGSFTGSVERMQALDSSFANYARTTNSSAAATELWNRLLAESGLSSDQLAKLLPQTIGEMTRLTSEAHNGAGGVGALSARTELLGKKMTDVVTAGRSMLDVFNEINGAAINSAKAEIAAEEAADKLAETLKRNGKALNKRGTDFDVDTKKGRENEAMVIALAEAGAKAAQGRFEETGSVEQATVVWERYVGKLRDALEKQGYQPQLIDAIVNRYARMPDMLDPAAGSVEALNAALGLIPGTVAFEVTEHGIVPATTKTKDLAYQIRTLPNGKTVVVGARTAEAIRDIRAAKAVLDSYRSKSITIGVRWTSSGDLKVPGGTLVKNARGGAYVPMADGGLRDPQIYPASNPPLYQFAEPETGGELFLPKRGDRQRGQDLLAIAAQWYGGMFIAAANGYVTPEVVPAASGLVSVAPPAVASMSTGNAKLESIEAYIAARNAIARLNEELRHNGRLFGLSTAKGRENTAAVIAAVRAAQEAAKAKYDETGSVTKANAAYDQHIAALKRTLAQQKVSAATIGKLMRDLARRPTYGAQPGPASSAEAIAYTEAEISAQSALVGLSDKLSLNKPIFSTGDEVGRENLTALFGFLKAAQSAAQHKLEESGSSKLARQVYEQYVAELRKILGGAGLAKAAIDALLNQYGRVVLTPNAVGGVYLPAGGTGRLGQAEVFPAGSPLYGFNEPGTGGELFLPRYGSQRRGEDILAIGAGWYGGRYVPAAVKETPPPTQVTSTLNVYPQTANLSQAELQWAMRAMDAHERVGRKR